FTRSLHTVNRVRSCLANLMHSINNAPGYPKICSGSVFRNMESTRDCFGTTSWHHTNQAMSMFPTPKPPPPSCTAPVRTEHPKAFCCRMAHSDLLQISLSHIWVCMTPTASFLTFH